MSLQHSWLQCRKLRTAEEGLGNLQSALRVIKSTKLLGHSLLYSNQSRDFLDKQPSHTTAEPSHIFNVMSVLGEMEPEAPCVMAAHFFTEHSFCIPAVKVETVINA